MKLLPRGHYYVRTESSPYTICTRLQQEIANSNLTAWREKQLFVGKVSEEGFDLYLSGYRKDSDFHIRNSAGPILKGTFHKDGCYTVIEVEERLAFAVKLFFAIWTSFFLGLIFLVGDVTFTLWAMAFILFAYFLTMAGFHIGSKSSKEELRKIIMGYNIPWIEERKSFYQ